MWRLFLMSEIFKSKNDFLKLKNNLWPYLRQRHGRRVIIVFNKGPSATQERRSVRRIFPSLCHEYNLNLN